MIDLTKEQKLQIIENRRIIMARNVFELQVDVVVMETQGRTDDVNMLNQRIDELIAADKALLLFIESV